MITLGINAFSILYIFYILEEHFCLLPPVTFAVLEISDKLQIVLKYAFAIRSICMVLHRMLIETPVS